MPFHWYPEGYSYPPNSSFPPGLQKISAKGSIPGRNYWEMSISGQMQQIAKTRKSLQPASSRRIHSSTTGSESSLIRGIDYFQIGETVRFRRYNNKKKEYSRWWYGRVVQPELKPSNSQCEDERHYRISYVDPHTGDTRTSLFSPKLKEISTLHSTIEEKVAVLISIPRPISGTLPPNSSEVWTPARLLPHSNTEIRAQVLQGPYRNQELIGAFSIIPYSDDILLRFRRLSLHDP